MKKILVILFLIFSFLPSQAMNFGMYKPETEYGLLDGFKINFKNRKEGKKIIQLTSETEEEKARIEREKKKVKQEIDENEEFRFIREGVVPF